MGQDPRCAGVSRGEVLFQNRGIVFPPQTGATGAGAGAGAGAHGAVHAADDVLLGFGTAVYRVPIAGAGQGAVAAPAGTGASTGVGVGGNNLVVNPGFELAANPGSADGYFYVYPCTTTAAYSTTCADGAATAFADSRTAATVRPFGSCSCSCSCCAHHVPGWVASSGAQCDRQPLVSG